MGRRSIEKSILFVVDFGLSKKYRDSFSKQHIPFAVGKSLTGTARYASLNSHQGFEQGRRDDLESIGYMLLYLLLGRLPWQGLSVSPEEGPDPSGEKLFAKIYAVKSKTNIEDLCRSNLIPPEFAVMIKYCRALTFEEEPDYNAIRRMFKLSFDRSKFGSDGVFDWQLRPKRENRKAASHSSFDSRLSSEVSDVNETPSESDGPPVPTAVNVTTTAMVINDTAQLPALVPLNNAAPPLLQFPPLLTVTTTSATTTIITPLPLGPVPVNTEKRKSRETPEQLSATLPPMPSPNLSMKVVPRYLDRGDSLVPLSLTRIPHSLSQVVPDGSPLPTTFGHRKLLPASSTNVLHNSENHNNSGSSVNRKLALDHVGAPPIAILRKPSANSNTLKLPQSPSPVQSALPSPSLNTPKLNQYMKRMNFDGTQTPLSFTPVSQSKLFNGLPDSPVALSTNTSSNNSILRQLTPSPLQKQLSSTSKPDTALSLTKRDSKRRLSGAAADLVTVLASPAVFHCLTRFFSEPAQLCSVLAPLNGFCLLHVVHNLKKGAKFSPKIMTIALKFNYEHHKLTGPLEIPVNHATALAVQALLQKGITYTPTSIEDETVTTQPVFTGRSLPPLT